MPGDSVSQQPSVPRPWRRRIHDPQNRQAEADIPPAPLQSTDTSWPWTSSTTTARSPLNWADRARFAALIRRLPAAQRPPPGHPATVLRWHRHLLTKIGPTRTAPSPTPRPDHRRADRTDGPREPDLGLPAHPRRGTQARLPRRRIHNPQDPQAAADTTGAATVCRYVMATVPPYAGLDHVGRGLLPRRLRGLPEADLRLLRPRSPEFETTTGSTGGWPAARTTGPSTSWAGTSPPRRTSTTPSPRSSSPSPKLSG